MRILARWFRPGLVALALAVSVVSSAQDKDSEAVQARVLSLMKVFKNADWKGLYSLVEMSPKVKAQLTGADDFGRDVAKGIRDSDPKDELGKLLRGLSGLAVGRPIIEKNYAYVPTTCVLTLGDYKGTLLGVAKMVKVDGVWKWDLAFTDDPQAATSKRTEELLGGPSVHASGG